MLTLLVMLSMFYEGSIDLFRTCHKKKRKVNVMLMQLLCFVFIVKFGFEFCFVHIFFDKCRSYMLVHRDIKTRGRKMGIS